MTTAPPPSPPFLLHPSPPSLRRPTLRHPEVDDGPEGVGGDTYPKGGPGLRRAPHLPPPFLPGLLLVDSDRLVSEEPTIRAQEAPLALEPGLR